MLFQSRSPTLPPSLKDELEARIEKLEAKVEKIRTGAKKQIKELEEKIDLVYELTTLTPQGQKEKLGGELFPMIQKINRDLAVKVTGMLLEQDNKKLLRMLDDEEYLNMEVNKALDILKTQP